MHATRYYMAKHIYLSHPVTIQHNPANLSITANVATLVHSASQRSVSASDDFYSVSELSISQASSDDRTTVVRYHTPIERPIGYSTPAYVSALSVADVPHDPSDDLAQPEDGVLQEHTDAHPVSAILTSSDILDEDTKTPQARMSRSDLAAEMQLPVDMPREQPYAVTMPDHAVPMVAASAPIAADSAAHHIGNGIQAHDAQQDRPLVPAPLAAIGSGNRTRAVNQQVTEEQPQTFYTTDSDRSVESSLPAASAAIPHSHAVQPNSEATTTQTIPRKPVSSGSISVPDGRSSWQYPRPGSMSNNDTPYIQFAIDQLTRDEELLGRSRDARGSPDLTPIPPSAVFAPEVSPLNSDDERGTSQELNRGERPVSPIAEAEVEQHNPSTLQTAERAQTTSPALAQETALPQIYSSRPGVISRLPPHDLFRYPPLTYIPASLRLLGIAGYAFTCIAYITLLAISLAWSTKNGGLWDYNGLGTGRYFLAQYLPQLLAVLLLLYMFVAQRALQRILPFVLLSHKPSSSKQNIFGTVPFVISNFLIPNSSCFQKGEPAIAYAAISFWLTLWTVPLASALYQTRLYGSQAAVWKWATVSPVAIVLMVLYVNLICAMLVLHFRLRRHPTGLKWDPVSLADLFVLLRPPTTPREGSQGHNPQRASLGYWESPTHPGQFYHGFGTSPSADRVHVEHGQPVTESRKPHAPAQTSTFDSWRSSTSIKLQPWFLRNSALIIFALVATALLIAFLVVSYLHSALGFGFNPLLATATSATTSFQAFSPSNFVFSFIPAIVGMLAALLWIPIDTSARVLAPYIDLSMGKSRGKSGLLLSYNSDPPFLTTIRALSHLDFYVAGSAFLAFLSWALPILGGGLLTAQYIPGDQRIYMRADPGGLAALSAFAIVYALGWILLWPTAGKLLRGGLVRKSRRRSSRGLRDLEKGRPRARIESATSDSRPIPAPPTDTQTAPSGTAPDPVQYQTGTNRGSLEDWLCGSDVRFLSGICEVMGESELQNDIWREPRTRADLVGRVVSRAVPRSESQRLTCQEVETV